MPASSGSPTQTKTSVETLAQLSGVPDDAFLPGDLGYVSDLFPNGTFRLVRRPGPVPPGCAPTWSGNGYWEPFQAAATVVVDPTTAVNQDSTTGVAVNSTTATMTAPMLSVHETFKNLKAAGSPVVVYTVGGALPAPTPTGAPRTLTVAFAGTWATMVDGITITGVGPDGNLIQEDVYKPVIGNPTTANAFFSVVSVAPIGSPTAGSTATITVGAGIGVANWNQVFAFYACVVDGVANTGFTLDAIHGTFNPTVAYTGGSQTVEVWYNRPVVQNPHTHGVTDNGHTHDQDPHTHTTS